MTSYRAILCALAMSIAATPSLSPLYAAEKKAAARKPPPGRTETLACRLGTEDRHARIAVVVIKGKTDSFAYYSKWKPRTCSVYLQRNRDNYSKWADSGNITTVNLEKGAFLIEHKPGEYHFIFRDIDRERYCGMEGVINGSLTIKRGSDQCVLDGEIMVEGTPLGEAQAGREPEGPLQSAGASDVAVQSAPAVTPEAPPAAKPAPVKVEAQAPAPARAASPEEQKPAVSSTASPGTASPGTSTPSASPGSASPSASSSQPAADAQRPAATPSSNPFSTFFRSLSTSRPPEESTQ